MNIDTRFRKEFDSFLSCLHEAGCLKYVIVIGSWAEYMYLQSGKHVGYEAPMKTMDLDFLIADMKKPVPPVHLRETALKYGFEYSEDYFDGTSKFTGAENFEVEFLVQQKAGGIHPAGRANIGVNPQALTHLSMLERYSEVIQYGGLEVRVPIPEAYAIHKMIINSRRGIKAAADREKVERILPFLNIKYAEVVRSGLTRKEKKMLEEYLSNYPEHDIFTVLSTK